MIADLAEGQAIASNVACITTGTQNQRLAEERVDLHLSPACQRAYAERILYRPPVRNADLPEGLAVCVRDARGWAKDLGQRHGGAAGVLLPQLAPALLVVGVLGFLTSFGEVTVTAFLTTARMQILPARIYAEAGFSLENTVNAVSTLLIGATLAALLLVSRVTPLDRAWRR